MSSTLLDSSGLPQIQSCPLDFPVHLRSLALQQPKFFCHRLPDVPRLPSVRSLLTAISHPIRSLENMPTSGSVLCSSRPAFASASLEIPSSLRRICVACVFVGALIGRFALAALTCPEPPCEGRRLDQLHHRRLPSMRVTDDSSSIANDIRSHSHIYLCSAASLNLWPGYCWSHLGDTLSAGCVGRVYAPFPASRRPRLQPSGASFTTHSRPDGSCW